MRQSQPIVILIIITMAIILAAGSFLALTYIQGRPEAPTGTIITNVEGVEVTIRTDPAKAVRILGFQEPLADSSLGQGEQPPLPPPDQTVGQPDPVVLPTEEPPPPVILPPPTPVPDRIIFEEYFVQQGDSLYSIATRPDTAITLMARHGISQDDLVPGSVILLPVGNPAYCAEGDRQPYAVGEGDTAFSIGRRFGVSADELKVINNLDENYTVYGASIICVPRR
jgi:LysM repeat protein